MTLTTSTTSGSSDLGLHPGFSIKPLFYCSNPHNISPLSHGLYIMSTSTMGLADALLDIAANVTSSPGAASTAVDGVPTLAIVEQDVGINDVVQLAASQNSSVGLGVPLIITSSLYPLQLGDPAPPPVKLDLSGCVGCVSLTAPPGCTSSTCTSQACSSLVPATALEAGMAAICPFHCGPSRPTAPPASHLSSSTT